MAIKAVLFDLDGTLLETHLDFEVVLNKLLKEENRPRLPSELIRATVSNGARALIKLGFGLSENDAAFEPLKQRLLDYYGKHLAVYSRPFPGITELLQQLQKKQLIWGVVTNKPDTYTQPLLRTINLQPAASTIICPDHVTHTKPHPEPLQLACQQLACSADEAIYIGDHLRDIECGKNAGMKTIAAAYGYVNNRSEAESWQADHVVDSAWELWPLINAYSDMAAS